MTDTMPDLSLFEQLRPAGHSVTVGALALGLAGALPMVLNVIGSLLGIAWFCICIYQSPTFQGWIHRKPK